MGDDAAKQQGEAAEREDRDVLHRDPAYFQYYSQFQHQQNMLQDYVRTSAYFEAITLNGPAVFKDRLVMDVGSGSGILSFFAVKAGAKHVYAVEASSMAAKMRAILAAAKHNGAASRNAYLADRITAVNAKIEEPRLVAELPRVDAIVSEPIGVLLVHERMIESFIYARDKFLRPGGAMLPSSGTIHLAPLSDAELWNETITKARFWQQHAFYGVDLNPYFQPAFDEYFSSPVVGCFSPNALMGDSVRHLVDFHTVSMDELKAFSIPVEWHIKYTGVMHGVAGWFDLAFVPPASALIPCTNSHATYMSTSPAAPATHWQQVRMLLKQPLAVNAGQVVRGVARMATNDQRSYDITLRLVCLDAGESAAVVTDAALEALLDARQARVRTAVWYLQEQVYNYAYTGEVVPAPKPEGANMYLPVDALLAESAGPAPPNPAILSAQPAETGPTDFLLSTAAAAALPH